MPEQGLSPDVVTYNTLMDRFCNVGNLKQTVNLFKQMTDSGNVPDTITYTILMDGMCKEGTDQEANRLLHDILKII